MRRLFISLAELLGFDGFRIGGLGGFPESEEARTSSSPDQKHDSV